AANVGRKAVPFTELCATVPLSVAQLIARCLEKNPAHRPQCAREMLASLEEAGTTGGRTAVPVAGPVERRPQTYWRAALGLGLAASLVVAAVFVTRSRS